MALLPFKKNFFCLVSFYQVLWDFLIFLLLLLIFDNSQKASSPLLAPTTPGFPPQRMLDQHGFLPWFGCSSVYSCSKCAVHAGLFPSWPPGFACSGCITGKVICSCEAVWSWNRTEMQLVDEPNVCLLSLYLGRTLVACQPGERLFAKPVSHGSWKSYLWLDSLGYCQANTRGLAKYNYAYLVGVLPDARNYSLFKAHGY